MTIRTHSLAAALVLASAAPASAQNVDIAWTEVVPPYTRAAHENYGAIQWDGTRMLIATTTRLDVFRFDGTSAPVWEAQLQPAVPVTGYPSAVAIDHGRVLAVANTAASGQFVYEFTLSGTTWTEVTHLSNPMPHPGDGTLVAVQIDGPHWAVSAPYIAGNVGSVDFLRSPGNPITWTTTNRSVIYGPGVFTGHVLTLRGSDLLVSILEGGTSSSGVVTLYSDDGTNLNPVVTIPNPTPGSIDQFGDDATLDDTYLYLGSHYDDTTATDAGAMYVYDRAGALHQTLLGTTAYGRFGGSISVDGDWMAVGAPTTFAVPGVPHLFMYHRDAAGTWQLRGTFGDPNGESATFFGLGIHLRGNAIVTSAVGANVAGATQAGRVWYGRITTSDGGACTADASCTHGHCVSGICCNTACSGTCDVCSTGTCAVMACMVDAGTDGGTDAGTDAAIARVDAGVDAGVDAASPPNDAGVDAASPPSDSGVDAASPPSDAGRDAGGVPDASAAIDASATPDAGGVPRAPLSCTCRTSPSGAGGVPLSLASIVLLALLGRRAHRA